MSFDSPDPAENPELDRPQGGLTESEKRETFVRLVFDGDEQRFEAFRQAILAVVPPRTRAVVRGSAITGIRWKDQAPFDADGPGTSDVDLTLVGADVLGAYNLSGFYVPGVHTRPMGEEDPDIAPALKDLREALTDLAGHPVNVQASRDWVLYLRGELIGQPYLTLIGDDEAPA
ncbi:hypothetical protein TBR22_A40250 [Luteitalea sp. TBR-22]|uniref:hypothetical protein n=1 Tax=Luteitalea sp. TBR-22 TaxID=2802971 RepID=UPI001AF8571D|nr:hypothetical protein [Luteitalea sp. TBR-22]BCS34799.1 hypothetical protein TBR22_A40250 [Luteitalea sp. TBR-22]